MDQWASLKLNLALHNKDIVELGMDGNCFYYCFCQHIFGCRDKAPNLRKLVAKYMTDDKKLLEAKSICESISEYKVND